jgi:ATP-dependent DNA helicase RecG
MASVSVEHVRHLPVEEVGRFLLAANEDQWFDRKSAATKSGKAIDTIVGMANADGGVIVFGLAEGRVQGVDAYPANVNELMQAGLDRAIPPIHTQCELMDCVRDDGKLDHLLIMIIAPSEQPHSTTSDVMYLRVGDETRKLSFIQRQELVFDKGQGQFEARTAPRSSRSDLDDGLVDDYTRDIDGSDPTRVLQARGALTREQQPTYAGILLFGRDPQEFLPEAYVRVLRYRGTERGAGSTQLLVSDARALGHLPRQLRRAREAVLEVQPVRRALRGDRFTSVPLIPEDAWLEGIVNAVIHRSYSLGGDHIRVDVFDDRIEIESPGRFPGLVDVTDPRQIARFARNPRIARVCSDLSANSRIGPPHAECRAHAQDARLRALGRRFSRASCTPLRGPARDGRARPATRPLPPVSAQEAASPRGRRRNRLARPVRQGPPRLLDPGALTRFESGNPVLSSRTTRP